MHEGKRGDGSCEHGEAGVLHGPDKYSVIMECLVDTNNSHDGSYEESFVPQL